MENRRNIGGVLLEQPEINVLIFGFLLNFPWEFLQAPFFEGVARADHWQAVNVCTLATIGDAVIMLIAYWSVATVASDRRWFRKASRSQLASFIAVGVVVTLGIEHFATRSSETWGWSYSEAMPTLPLLGVGLTPVLQWILLPPFAIWFVRRQLRTEAR